MDSTFEVPGAARRPMAALCSGTALMNAAMAMTSAAGTLAAADRLGTGWGGVPNTAGIVGTGAGALLLTRAMRRTGRRRAFVLGYAVAAVGAGLAAAAVARGDVALLCAGMLLLGLGNAAAQLSRYAAAELRPPGRRGSAIGLVVAAAAVGAVGGPLLLDTSAELAGRLFDRHGAAVLAGPFLAGLLACVAASAAAAGTPSGRPGSGARPSLRTLARVPAARTALPVMATAQAVMVAVMTAAPLHMHLHGAGLTAVGITLAAHTLGMFALAPVSGRLFDRYGARPVLLAGLATLAGSAVLDALLHGPVTRATALFLLGYGWNLCFVGGSGMLARDLPESLREHAEGAVDAAVWTIAAAASLLSTVLMSAGGHGMLAGAACVLTLWAARRVPSGRKGGEGEPGVPGEPVEPGVSGGGGPRSGPGRAAGGSS
ncbi:MFS transporter [Actinomadura cremea]|nr:MFS transporter [Actinomadura cremea]